MNQKIRLFILITIASTTTISIQAAKGVAFGKPFFNQRSQGDNLARRMVGEEHFLEICVPNCIHGTLSITPEWTESFRSKGLGTYFSFNTTNHMNFAGQTSGVITPDIRAENFLLADSFNGNSVFNPRVENCITDINFRLNLDEFVCGLYVELGLPFVYTRWNMHLKDVNSLAPSNTLEVFDVESTPLFRNITAAFASTNLDTKLNNTNITVQRMHYGTIDGRRTKLAFSDLKIIIGYNYICHEQYHAGFNLRIIAPAGTHPEGEYMFEPIAGNGHHWQVGGGLSAHTTLWEKDCNRSISFWMEAAVYHLFRSNQKRSYDFKNNGIGSRYLLLKMFNPDDTFANLFVPAINKTTLDTHIKVGVTGEAAFFINYLHGGWTLDLGYNVWGRSKEHLELNEEIAVYDNFGIAGDFSNAASLNRTASMTKINGENSDDYDGTTLNDNVYIETGDLDLKSAQAPSAISHKVFAHLGYIWDHCKYAPFFGVGGEAELSGRHNKALTQWGVWLKGGFAFV